MEYKDKTIKELIQERNELKERIRELAHPIDELTGLYTWVHFLNFAEREFERARRFKRPMSVILLDVDHLKKINEVFGEKCGNQILVEVSKICRENIRDLDFVGCYEGGKFILLLIEIKKSDAEKVAKRLQKVIASKPIVTDKGPATVTVSIGIADLSSRTPDLSSVFEKAEDTLFLTKVKGRNRSRKG
jgi:two-component system chemotaxis family response regulator WspR